MSLHPDHGHEIEARQRKLSQAKQARATAPGDSLWVSANAGSGKTYLLTRRVIRLMLEGCRPSQLLCLTFTKAAAAEMSNRIFGLLGEWAVMPDGGLRAQIEDLTGRKPHAADLVRARKLFALALDTPGGLRIQTIHAFCEALLHRFPLEANVPGRFEMLGDIERDMLLAEARRRVELASLGLGPLAPGGQDADTIQLAEAFDTVRDHAGDAAIEEALAALIGMRHRFGHWLAATGSGRVGDALEPLWHLAGIDPESDRESVVEQAAMSTAYTPEALDALAGAISAKGGSSAPALVETLQTLGGLLRSGGGAEAILAARSGLFLTQGGKPRASLYSRSFMEEDVGRLDTFRAEQTELLRQFDRIRTFDVLTASRALFEIAATVLTEYENLKRARGRLDFDDLIGSAAMLLAREGIGPWVRYKLDQGISHVLVDEAQDTNPLQWSVIEAITEDFFAGDSGHEEERTLFVVGDEKQSIYSFQGADIREFSQQRQLFGKRVQAIRQSAQPFEELQLSFRSTTQVLSAVDQVFSLPENRKGLGTEDGPRHNAKRFTDRGDVLLWEPEIKPRVPAREDWHEAPPEQGKDAEVRLAGRIARTIRKWTATDARLPGMDRPLRNGDFLILVRKRDRFVNAMIRALKAEGLTTAGADRLKLTHHIAIEDLLMLGRFASTQIDDLALAGILKSPIFGFDEQALFDLAHDRGGRLLIERLRERALQDGKSREARALSLIDDVLSLAPAMPVFDFYARLFARYGLRRLYVARHGHEVEEVLDGFFDAAIGHDRSGRGLQAFVEEMLAAEPELKREMETEADEIRVITVHSAKGLEAPVVFLVDPGNPAYQHHMVPDIAWVPAGHNHPEGPVWIASKDSRIALAKPFLDWAQQAAEEEYRRLLYVGMTRAADRLIVCGYASEQNRDKDNWFNMVKRGLQAEPLDKQLNGRLVPYEDDGATCWRWEIGNRFERDRPIGSSATQPLAESPSPLPAWVTPARREAVPPRPLSPSDVPGLIEANDPAPQQQPAGADLALARGTAMHHLLQLLPDVPPQDREATIGRYFSASGFASITARLDATVRTQIASDVLALLSSPDMAALFGDGSHAEVDVVGKVGIAGREQLVRGKIDRLAVDGERVVFADYKTGALVPDSADAAPIEYLVQMALYRELLRPVHPGKRIKAMLIWTNGPVLMPIPGALMDQVLADLGRHGSSKGDQPE